MGNRALRNCRQWFHSRHLFLPRRRVSPPLERVGDWRGFLDGGLDDDALDAARRPGRPSLEANAEG